MTTKHGTDNLPVPIKAQLLNKSNKALAIRQSGALAGDYMAHPDIVQVKRFLESNRWLRIRFHRFYSNVCTEEF